MMRRMLLSLIRLAWFSQASTCVTRQADWKIGQVVATSSGPVTGHDAGNSTGVSEYLGIPYAQPPVGELRFQPPVAYKNNSTISGASFGDVCMALASFAGLPVLKRRGVQKREGTLTPDALAIIQGYSAGIPPINEDCLTINVWTKPQVGEEKKAVLVWIHGGGYTSGSSAVPFYNGKKIAEEQDLVIVSFNYRLNIFGFPGSETYPAYNVGLLDQRLAIEWVRDNIANFGGDPARITIVGQSAGGGSVGYHSYAFTDDPIVSGYVLESAVTLNASSPGGALASWVNAAKAVGCDTAESPDRCMQLEVSAEALLDASGQYRFGPTIDGSVVFADYTTRKPNPGAVLVGHNDFEPGLQRPLSPTLPDAYWQQAELSFTCPAAERAAYYALNGNPTWRYRWFGDWGNLRLAINPSSGAWHGSEIMPLFDTIPQTVSVSTPEETSVAAYLRGAWAAFAKNPIGGLSDYEGGWPQYSTDGDSLVRLAYNNITGTNLAPGNYYDNGCPEYPVVGGT
ncbi:carboxylesterase [Truncatella angustata]|uniref:Carboxylic ester hydrolase n=1 Tax=Truncatella angustata TaxID=152316 RepID=A0A9P9A089_9PEZI|nr:carboxylesterase [Truncatella angustata]KAH6657018.1 carboxylesterase [Truncatella angustata]